MAPRPRASSGGPKAASLDGTGADTLESRKSRAFLQCAGRYAPVGSDWKRVAFHNARTDISQCHCGKRACAFAGFFRYCTCDSRFYEDIDADCSGLTYILTQVHPPNCLGR